MLGRNLFNFVKVEKYIEHKYCLYFNDLVKIEKYIEHEYQL